MEFQEIIQQYRGATLPQLIEKQIKSMNESVLDDAIQGTYENLPADFRQTADTFTQSYIKNWFGPHILNADLSDVFSQAIQDINTTATQAGVQLTNSQLFDVFNLAVMRLSFFAHSKPELRKMLGIKKGWFS